MMKDGVNLCSILLDGSDRKDLALGLMRLGLVVYLLLFPFGTSFREIGSVVSLIGLASHYILGGYATSNLRRFSLKWTYLAFLAFIIFKAFHSISPSDSLTELRHNIYQGFVLVFAGMEFVRRPAQARFILILLVLAGFLEGLTGVWQYSTGFDPITRQPLWNEGRLTGTMFTPRVGDYMSLILPAGFALYWLLPQTWSLTRRVVVAVTLLFPAWFLLAGAQSRSGWLAALAGLTAFVVILRRFRITHILLTLAGLAVLLGVLLLLAPDRLSLARIVSDPRWILWQSAVTIFLEYPLFGAGINTFSAACAQLGLVNVHIYLLKFEPHPHNVYLQLLCETGVTGLILFLTFFLSWMGWSFVRARRIVAAGQENGVLAAALWASGAAYAVNAISAHGYFRSWWLGLAMSLLGALVGMCLSADQDRKDG